MPARPSLFSRLPWLTLVLSAAAVVAWHLPGAVEALTFDRRALAAGECWRLLTGHLVHWTASHLTWDVLAFLGLGAVVEWQSRRVFTLTVVISALAISGVVWFATPWVASYRGLSGLDTALFAAAVTTMARDAVQRRAWLAATVPATALLGFVAKSLVEWLGHTTVFVAASDVFAPVPIAHLAGAITGIGVALAVAPSRRSRLRPAGWRVAAATVPGPDA